MSSTTQGRLVRWLPDKGYGFIRPDDGGKDVFVHLRDFGRIARAPRVGDVIRFQRIADGKGRFRAADVEVAGLTRESSVSGRSGRAGTHSTIARGMTWRLLVVIAFTVVLAICSVRTALHPFIVAAYLVASPVAWLLYVFDKAAAMNGRQRTRENTLLLTGLLGGWPGALLAQGMFRHKSRKTAFLLPFWITVAMNCAALAWACTVRLP
jgi:uncharacterized membrane protein YsdA (DUF1294 family)/cold shock CspA family protein